MADQAAETSGHRSRLRQRLFDGGGKALLDHELSTIRKEANEASEELTHAMNAALEDLRKADAVWPSAGALHVLPSLQSRLAFLQKWQAQLREALLRLEIGEL